QPQSQPYWPGVIWGNAKFVLFEDTLLLTFPELNIILDPVFSARLLQKQSRRKLCKSFREPLIVVRSPTHRMSPPLMRDFMRRDFIDKALKLGIDFPEQHPALGRVDIGGHRQVDKVGPGLSEAEVRLLGDVNVIERTLPVIVSA